MYYEITMLKDLAKYKRNIGKLAEIIKLYAIKSFNPSRTKNGTFGQFDVLLQMINFRERLDFYVSEIMQALSMLKPSYRALLKKVYVQGVAKTAIAKKYHVSVATVYRKIHRARNDFRRILHKLGYTEEWFNNFTNEEDDYVNVDVPYSCFCASYF